MGRFGEADLHHLARDVPLVGGLVDAEAFVALDADQLGAERLGERLGQLGLADAGFTFQEERSLEGEGEEGGGGEAAVGDVVLPGQEGDDVIDGERGHGRIVGA